MGYSPSPKDGPKNKARAIQHCWRHKNDSHAVIILCATLHRPHHAYLEITLEKRRVFISKQIWIAHYAWIEALKAKMDFTGHCRDRQWDPFAPFQSKGEECLAGNQASVNPANHVVCYFVLSGCVVELQTAGETQSWHLLGPSGSRISERHISVPLMESATSAGEASHELPLFIHANMSQHCPVETCDQLRVQDHLSFVWCQYFCIVHSCTWHCN